MINASAPFPYQGADALIERDGKTVAVRIIQAADRDGLFTVSGGAPGASGTSRVTRAELIDPTPLTAAERRELLELERTCLKMGGPVGKKAREKRARFMELGLRDIHSGSLAALKSAQRWAA